MRSQRLGDHDLQESEPIIEAVKTLYDAGQMVPDNPNETPGVEKEAGYEEANSYSNAAVHFS